MVLRLEALPPELQASIAGMCDAAAAGAFAQLNHACRLLLQPRLAALLVAHRQAMVCADAAELQRAFATRAGPALLEMNDMGGGQLAIYVVTREVQLRAATTRFSCECCGFQDGRPCGHGFSNLQRHLASKTHWIAHRLRVHNLPFDNVAWHAFVVRLPSHLIGP